MTHQHPVFDTDAHFTIDPITRAITNTESNKIALMQYDHNSECFSFSMPKEIEGHDMTLCNDVKIHYINISGSKSEKHADVYNVTDFEVSADDPAKCTFTWTISENATQYAGGLSFLIKFTCVQDGVVVYRWNTDINQIISIKSGMNNGDAIEEDYSDILSEWEARINALEEGVSKQVDQTYNPESENSQSGKAVAEAVSIKADKTYVDEQIEDISASVDEQIGDISTALDNVIALQESLIGGGEE